MQLSTGVTCVLACHIEDEKQMKEVKRRVMDDEHGRMFDKLIELTNGTTGNLCSMLDRFKVCEERSDDESFIAKMKENREWFLGLCLGPGHREQMPVPTHGDQLLRVKVQQDDDVGSFASWRKEHVEARITERRRTMLSDDVNATMTQIDRFKVQRHTALLCSDHQYDGSGRQQHVTRGTSRKCADTQCFDHVRYYRTSNGLCHQGFERLVFESVPKAQREMSRDDVRRMVVSGRHDRTKDRGDRGVRKTVE